MAWAVTADPDRFDEAVDWFDTRFPVTPDLRDKLDDFARTRAWTVAGVTQLDVVLEVYESIRTAIERGTPLSEWKADIRKRIGERWGKGTSSRLDTIFRTNTQSAYNRGRYLQARTPSVLKVRPFWMFDAILDSRTTPICTSRNRTVLPADDPWWDTNIPPLHHRCRSGIRSLRRSQAERRGISTKPPDAPDADGTFGRAPRADELEPLRNKYPDRLWKPYQVKKAGAPHHKREYWTKKLQGQYGDAAETVAWGRAAEEFALDQKAADALKPLRDSGWSVAKDFAAHLEQLLTKDDLTLRHAVRRLTGTTDEHMTRHFRAAAAISGHLQRIERHSEWLGPKPSWPRKPLKRQRAEAHYASAAEMLRVLTDRKVGPGGKRPGLGWHDRRAHWDGSRIRASYRRGAIEHEWGHALEDMMSRLGTKARAFLQARTKGEAVKQLRKLLPGHGYKPNEWAWPDKFLRPYVGKRYARPDGKLVGTEITSMGLELMALDLLQLYSTDADHFWFVLGQLAGG